MRDDEIVFFDVDTTGFAKEDEIIRITACTMDRRFNVYITPTRPVHNKSTKVNGLELINNKLFLHGKEVHSVPARFAFYDFMNYLREFNKNIILIAHNCFGFDMPRVLNLAQEVGYFDEFSCIVSGFSDSLVILKKVLKDKREGKGSFTLKTLVQDYLHVPVGNSDNAELLLMLLFNSTLDPISKGQIMRSSKTIAQYFETKVSKMQVAKAKKSLRCYRKVLSNWVINKMAKAKIDGNLLRKTYQNDGFQGVKRLFSKYYCGQPNVTRNINIIRKICSSLENDVESNTESSDNTEVSNDEELTDSSNSSGDTEASDDAETCDDTQVSDDESEEATDDTEASDSGDLSNCTDSSNGTEASEDTETSNDSEASDDTDLSDSTKASDDTDTCDDTYLSDDSEATEDTEGSDNTDLSNSTEASDDSGAYNDTSDDAEIFSDTEASDDAESFYDTESSSD